jgi:hypothetical protein
MGQLNLGQTCLTWRGKKDEGEAPSLDIKAAHFFQPDQLEESHSRIRIGYADHGVEVFDHIGPSFKNGSSTVMHNSSQQDA